MEENLTIEQQFNLQRFRKEIEGYTKEQALEACLLVYKEYLLYQNSTKKLTKTLLIG